MHWISEVKDSVFSRKPAEGNFLWISWILSSQQFCKLGSRIISILLIGKQDGFCLPQIPIEGTRICSQAIWLLFPASGNHGFLSSPSCWCPNIISGFFLTKEQNTIADPKSHHPIISCWPDLYASLYPLCWPPCCSLKHASRFPMPTLFLSFISLFFRSSFSKEILELIGNVPSASEITVVSQIQLLAWCVCVSYLLPSCEHVGKALASVAHLLSSSVS